MPIQGSKSVLIAGRSSLYVAKRTLYAFLIKFIFGRGTKQSNKLLLALLNDVFNVPKGLSLGTVEITNPLTFQTNVTDQYAILDIRAKVVGFGHVNLEMQRVNQRNIDKRTLYYGAKLFEDAF